MSPFTLSPDDGGEGNEEGGSLERLWLFRVFCEEVFTTGAQGSHGSTSSP
jgi:hypothetical protein